METGQVRGEERADKSRARASVEPEMDYGNSPFFWMEPSGLSHGGTAPQHKDVGGSPQ